MNTTRTPDNWPATLHYLHQPTYSPAITPSQTQTLHTPSRATATWPKIATSSLPSPCTKVRITPITSTRHPANSQHGLFATQHLSPGAFVLPYLGRIHTNDSTDTDPDSDYDLSLDRELGLAIDATEAGNEARFVNDYRGVAAGANVEFRDCWVQIIVAGAATESGDGDGDGHMRVKGKARWERRIGVFVLPAGKAGKKAAGIRAGEEIVVNYGRSFWSERRKGER